MKTKAFLIITLMMMMIVTIGALSNRSTQADINNETPIADNHVSMEQPLAFDESGAADLKLVSENDGLILYYHPETTEIAVRDKRNNLMWYSNPVDRAEDTVANSYNKTRLGVQLELTYFDSRGNRKSYNNVDQSVQMAQFEVFEMEKGIKIVYTLSQQKEGQDHIPKYISEERFNEVILARLPDEEKQAEILRRFKYVEEESVYERRNLSGLALERVLKIFEEIEYNQEDRKVDFLAYGAEEMLDSETFVVPLIYRLDGDSLVVSVPGDEMVYPETATLHSIALLPFFGAAHQSKEGYIFVPDGSGSLIHLNNGKVNLPPYVTTMYGPDLTQREGNRLSSIETSRLPVFGLKQDNQAFVAIIESGDSLASIEANISGRVNSYNNVFTSYTISLMEELTLMAGGRSNTIPQFQSQPYRGDITVRYGFLAEDSSDYVGMAEYYRNYLIDKYQWSRIDDEAEIPFYVELIGGIEKKKFFLGIPFLSYQPLTTFDEAKEIIGQLQEKGIHNIKIRYAGWFNDGVAHKIPYHISVDPSLGGKKDLNQLVQFASLNQIDLFPDVAFTNIYKDTFRFSASKDAARFITGKPVKRHPFNLASNLQDRSKNAFYVLSPTNVPKVVSSFMQHYEHLAIPNLSLRELGSELNSDFNKKNSIHRELSKSIVEEQFITMKQSVDQLMITGGNAYALPYSDHIVNAPMTNSGLSITDRGIPFFQIALHGYIEYSGKPTNKTEVLDPRIHLLRSLETGSNLYYSWFYNDPSAIMGTEFNDLYSANYKVWMEEAAQMYEELNRVLNRVRTKVITDHKQWDEGVYQTTFENEASILVNYNNYAVEANGIVIEAMSYELDGVLR